jgi:quercetin dioxygenase-like cupin family protein
VRLKTTLAVVIGLIGIGVYAASVLATAGSGFTAAQQWKGAFDRLDVRTESAGSDAQLWKNLPGPAAKPAWFWSALAEYEHRHADAYEVALRTKLTSDLWITRNAIEPGGHSGWHTHPGPSLIVVTAGEITAYAGDDPGCTPRRYKAGEGFVDPGGAHVHLLRNESGAPAETVAVQFLQKDATRRIDMPAPGNCPF